MAELRGWLLDIYPDPQEGAALWLLAEDGERRLLRLAMPVSFYIGGPPHRLRQAAAYLGKAYPRRVDLEYTRREELFAGKLDVLAVRTGSPARLPKVFYSLKQRFPDLDYYDTDITVPMRAAALYGLFPLARCRLELRGADEVTAIEVLETLDDLAPEPPPLRVMTLEPDVDPEYAPPSRVLMRVGRTERRIRVEDSRAWVGRMHRLIARHDPDLILSRWGDTWLFPYLLDLAQKYGTEFNPNRDTRQGVERRRAFSYHTYGQVLHRGQQVHLFGRWHVDRTNAVMYGDYELLGVLEQARLSGLPVQETARKSPGAGITAMQIRCALRRGLLVPFQKQQAEAFKTPAELIRADRGGLVGQPLSGLHENVAGIDFFSMYPQLMKHFNISPETMGLEGSQTEYMPGLGTPIRQDVQGLVPETVAPLLARRFAIKEEMARLDPRDYRYAALKARAKALKWLLVVCFGYLGHKHFRWMRVEAHEAVTAFGREALMQAKETAESLGFRVLSFNVDGLYIKKAGAAAAEDFQGLLDAVRQRSGLPIALDGIYRWMAFLPSRRDSRVPVANRYFGAFQDGEIKVRGIEMRRHDTPPFIYDTQAEMLRFMAQAEGAAALRARLPELLDMLQMRVTRLRAGGLGVEELLVAQRLSRMPAEYKAPSPGARAAKQLAALGKDVRPGQKVLFLYTKTKPGVTAWNAGMPFHFETVDVEHYVRLLVRAAGNLLQPLGVEERSLEEWLAEGKQLFPLGVWQATMREKKLVYR